MSNRQRSEEARPRQAVHRQHGRRMAFAATVSMIVAVLLPAAASAALPPLLWQTPEDGLKGRETGRMEHVRSIAADPASGNVLVLDPPNARIDEYSPWGQLLRVMGWDVVASGPDNQPPVNERQEVSLDAASGSFRIEYVNAYDRMAAGVLQETAPIAADASATAVRNALTNLPSLAPGNVSVSGPAGGPWTVEFVAALADHDIPQLTIVTHDSSGASTLTGGAESAAVKTVQVGGSYEVCVLAAGDECQPGQNGDAAPGELAGPSGIAADPTGGFYVQERYAAIQERPNFRIQKFDSAGRFLFMIGGEVNKTRSEDPGSNVAERNLCTQAQIEGGDTCGAGIPGNGDGQFAEMNQTTAGTRIAVDSTGSLFVGDEERIERFGPEGEFEADIAVPGLTFINLVLGSEGDFYATLPFAGRFPPIAEEVRKLSPTGITLAVFPAVEPEALAAAPDGGIYIAEPRSATSGEGGKRVVKLDANGDNLISSAEGFQETSDSSGSVSALASSSACGISGDDVYSAIEGSVFSEVATVYVRAYGPPPDPNLCPPPRLPPTIAAQYADAVGRTSATVAAEINPHFWPDTKFYVEYGVGKCSEGGCGRIQPAAPGLTLSGVFGGAVRTQGISLSDLQPETTYHYRFVASSSGGGPVRGAGGTPGVEGAEATFTTAKAQAPAASDSCPNADLRLGASALLPDCRSYEMVSPVDKEGADIAPLGNEDFFAGSLMQSAVGGERFAYTTYKAFGEPQSAPYASQYLAIRTSQGWTSKSISPPRTVSLFEPTQTFDTEFKAFSPNLCSAWLVHDSGGPSLAPGDIPGYANVYRRENCGEESYTALSIVEPPHLEPKKYQPEVQGIAGDGSRVIFRVADSLTPDAPNLGELKSLLYEARKGAKPRFVCVLPSGAPVTAGCSAGTGSTGFNDTRHSAVKNAISGDGSRIYWSDSPQEAAHIYLRVNGKSPTIPVSTPIANDPAQFWLASNDGSRALFSFTTGAHEGDLYLFDAADESRTLIAHKVVGVLGASEDASRIYFGSEEALGGDALAGQKNLYLYEAGSGISYVATLSRVDAAQGKSVAFAPLNPDPSIHSAEVSPDGLHAVFMSTGRPTGFDNIDVESGESDAEVYLYDAPDKRLTCVSCNPTGVRPAGRDIGPPGAPFWASARIRVATKQLYEPQTLSADGRRLFFDSMEGLVPDDTNGREDVYEWEAAGEGTCEEDGASFHQSTEGCVSLISTGEGSEDSRFLGASQSGADAFFATGSSLVPKDPGLIDVYDARIDGGYPVPIEAASCEGEACQGPPAPPNDPTPASSAYRGPGNLVGARPKPHCGKSSRPVRAKGRTTCVKKRKAKPSRRKHQRNKRSAHKRRQNGAGR